MKKCIGINPDRMRVMIPDFGMRVMGGLMGHHEILSYPIKYRIMR